MIVTKRESMASLIHDTSPILRHSLQQSHNKGLYYGFRDAIRTFSFGHYHQARRASCSILYILVLSLVISPFIFLLLLAVRVIERNNNFLCSLHQ